MKNIRNYVAAYAATFIGLCSCTSEYVPFEMSDDCITYPSAVSDILSESLSGQIKLKWTVPEDSNYYFVRVSYYDPLLKKEIHRLASNYENTMLIDGTRKRFGDYEFSFQTFNSKNQGGDVQLIKAVSGAAPQVERVISESKVPLSVEQLSFNVNLIEGNAKDLIDGSLSTYVNTPYQGADMSKAPFYVQVDLIEPLCNFKVGYSMPSSKATGPKIVKIMVSDGGDNWREIKQISSGLVTGKGESWTSDLLKTETPFSQLRFIVEQSTSGGKYAWNMSEFVVYNVQLDIYDPETAPLNR